MNDAMLLMALILCVGSLVWCVSNLFNQKHRKTQRSQRVNKAMLEMPADLNPRIKLAEGRGCIGIDQFDRTLHIVTPSGNYSQHEPGDLLGVELAVDENVTYQTRGTTTGLDVGGILIGSSSVRTAKRTRIGKSYLTLTLNDYSRPTIKLPFDILSRAEYCQGLITVFMQASEMT